MSGAATIAKPPFVGSPLCASHERCHVCRTSADFRATVAQHFDSPAEFACPEGITVEKAAEMRRQQIEARAKQEPPLPPMLQRAGNLAKAGGRVLRAVIDGAEVAISEEAFILRMAACVHCPSGQYRPSDQSCAECGCPVRRKALLATEDCKLGYWHGKVKVLPGSAVLIVPTPKPPVKVLTPNLWLDLKDSLLAILPRDFAGAIALRQYEVEAAKPAGCTGCHRRRLQAAALRAGMTDVDKLPADVLAQLQVLLVDYHLVLDSQNPRPLPAALRL